jgi:hypothetical protein
LRPQCFEAQRISLIGVFSTTLPRAATGIVSQIVPFAVLMRLRLRQPCLSYWTSS